MKYVLSIGISFLFITQMFGQKPIFTTSKVEKATVYSNAAELSHTTSVNLPKGSSEIVVKNVANYVNESTIQIAAPENVTILSVQFTTNYISEYEIDETNPLIKQVRDSISLVNKEIQKIQVEKTSHQKTIELLDKNQQVAGENNGLQVAELMKLVEYYHSKRPELNNKFNLLHEKEQNWNDRLKKLNDRLVISTSKEDKTSQGKLILQVMNEKAGVAELGINYITSKATWNPFYDLRATNISSPIDLLYKGQITQNTGIDWKQVKLTLSSGTPNQNNIQPILQAWFLRFGTNRLGYYNNQNAKMNVIQSLEGKVAGLQITNNGVPGASAVAEIADDFDGSIDKFTTINDNQLNISFDIDIPYDIYSNNKKHSVVLKELKIPATYKYYSVPRVEKTAFLLAEIKDYSQFNLLPGEANVIFDNLYVGKVFLDPNQTEETMNISLGRDKKISVTREKIADKSGTKFLSGSKEQTFTYDITIKNNKKETIDLLLKDQYPISTDEKIIVEDIETDKAEVNLETGIMTWKMKLSPNETKKIRISYKVKYPKDQMIDNL